MSISIGDPGFYGRLDIERHAHRNEYWACGRPVYFIDDDWYRDVYAPAIANTILLAATRIARRWSFASRRITNIVNTTTNRPKSISATNAMTTTGGNPTTGASMTTGMSMTEVLSPITVSDHIAPRAHAAQTSCRRRQDATSNANARRPVLSSFLDAPPRRSRQRLHHLDGGHHAAPISFKRTLTQPTRGTATCSPPFSKEQLPEYTHYTMVTNVIRHFERFKRGEKVLFHLVFYKTPERQEFMHFSIPSLLTMPAVLIVRKEKLAEFHHEGHIRLEDVLHDENIIIGLSKDRSYGNSVDAVLKKYSNRKNLVIFSGQELSENFFKMLMLDRLDGLIGRPTRLCIRRKNWVCDQIATLLIEEKPTGLRGMVLFCGLFKNEWGRNVIEKLIAFSSPNVPLSATARPMNNGSTKIAGSGTGRSTSRSFLTRRSSNSAARPAPPALPHPICFFVWRFSEKLFCTTGGPQPAASHSFQSDTPGLHVSPRALQAAAAHSRRRAACPRRVGRPTAG